MAVYPLLDDLEVVVTGGAACSSVKLRRMTRMYQLYAEHYKDGRVFCGHYHTMDDVRDRYVRSNDKEIRQGPGWNTACVPVVVAPGGAEIRLLEETTPWAREVNRQMAAHGRIKNRHHRDIDYPRGRMVKGEFA